MLSNTCKYAIRAVIYLAINHKDNQKIGIKRIAEEMNLPLPFLGKILQVLAKKGVLSSTKGPHGGFSIGKNPHEIAFLEIVEIIDGRDVFDNCLLGLEICKDDPSKREICPLHPLSDPIRFKLLKLFQEQTVGDAADKLKEVNMKFNL